MGVAENSKTTHQSQWKRRDFAPNVRDKHLPQTDTFVPLTIDLSTP